MKRETLSQLASLNLNKPSKPIAWNLFESLVHDIEQAYAVGNGGEIPQKTLEDLGKLYQFFKPAIPKNPKTTEQWLAKAMAKKDVRYYLNYLYSDGNRLVATDGHRLHIVNEHTVKAGYYDTEMTPCECDGKYPEIDRVIPNKDTTPKFGVIEIDKLVPADIRGNKGPVECFKLKEEHTVGFQGEYIRDAISMMAEPVAYYDEENPYSSILIEDATNPKLQAVVMCMRL